MIFFYQIFEVSQVTESQKIRAAYLKYLPWVGHQGELKKPHSGAIYNDLMNILAEKLHFSVSYKFEKNQFELMKNVSNDSYESKTHLSIF